MLPPRKRTRRSYSLSQNDNADESSPTRNEFESQTTLSTREEVPDSQESPAKVNAVEPFQSQADMIALEEDKPPSSARSKATSKRKAASTKQLTKASAVASTPSSMTKSKHKRFGSEEPSESLDNVEAEMDDAGEVSTETPVSDDDDEAPEVATTRNLPDSSLPSTTRKTRTKKAEPKATASTVPSRTTIDEDHASDIPAYEAELSQLQETPTLTIDTSQKTEPAFANASQDSEDSAFTTARSSRYTDVFSTPVGGTPQLKSPDLNPNLALTHQQLIPASTHTSLDIQVSRPSRSVPRSERIKDGYQALPRKAGNSLETYRRQLLQNRAEKAAKSARGGKFRLQSDWAGKKRSFVVGY